MLTFVFRHYSKVWPLTLFSYCALVWGYAWGRGFGGNAGWTAFALTALGFVFALWMLCLVDLLAAGRRARADVQLPYSPLPPLLRLPAVLNPYRWLIAPAGAIFGFYVGCRFW
jgi:hypothetical protein